MKFLKKNCYDFIKISLWKRKREKKKSLRGRVNDVRSLIVFGIFLSISYFLFYFFYFISQGGLLSILPNLLWLQVLLFIMRVVF